MPLNNKPNQRRLFVYRFNDQIRKRKRWKGVGGELLNKEKEKKKKTIRQKAVSLSIVNSNDVD